MWYLQFLCLEFGLDFQVWLAVNWCSPCDAMEGVRKKIYTWDRPTFQYYVLLRASEKTRKVHECRLIHRGNPRSTIGWMVNATRAGSKDRRIDTNSNRQHYGLQSELSMQLQRLASLDSMQFGTRRNNIMCIVNIYGTFYFCVVSIDQSNANKRNSKHIERHNLWFSLIFIE